MAFDQYDREFIRSLVKSSAGQLKCYQLNEKRDYKMSKEVENSPYSKGVKEGLLVSSLFEGLLKQDILKKKYASGQKWP